MIELVHDQRQVHTLHMSVISSSLSQTVGAEIAAQSHLFTDSGDDLPGLATPDWFFEMTSFGVEKDEMVAVIRDSWLRNKVFVQSIHEYCY